MTDVNDLVCMLRIVLKLDAAQSVEQISQKIPNMLMEVWSKYLLLLKKYVHMFRDHPEVRQLLQLVLEALLKYAQNGLLLLLDSSPGQDPTTAAKLKYVFFICQRISATLSVSGRVAVDASVEGLAFLVLAAFRGLSYLSNMDENFVAAKGEDLVIKAVGPFTGERLSDLLQRAFLGLSIIDARMKPLAIAGLCHASCLHIEKTSAVDRGESIQTAVSTVLSSLLTLSCAHITSVQDKEVWTIVLRLADSLLALESTGVVTMIQVSSI